MDTKFAGPVGLVGGGVAGALLGGVVGSKVGHKNVVATIGGAVLGSFALGLVGVIGGSWYGANQTELASLPLPVVPSVKDIEKMFP